MVQGRSLLLSDSCLHSTMDASQIRDVPFSFGGQVGLFVVVAILMWKHMRTAIYVPVCSYVGCSPLSLAI